MSSVPEGILVGKSPITASNTNHELGILVNLALIAAVAVGDAVRSKPFGRSAVRAVSLARGRAESLHADPRRRVSDLRPSDKVGRPA